jgi:hypothetical protein
MPVYEPDPIQAAIARVIKRVLEWQKAATRTRCGTCGNRAKRSEAEVALSIAVDSYKAAVAPQKSRFTSEPPTVKRRK